MATNSKLMEIVLKIYDKIEQGNDKLEARILSMEEKVSEVKTELQVYNQTLIKNDSNLQEHMMRTSNLEKIIIEHEKYVSGVQMVISLIGLIATLIGIYSFFLSS